MKELILLGYIFTILACFACMMFGMMMPYLSGNRDMYGRIDPEKMKSNRAMQIRGVIAFIILVLIIYFPPSGVQL